MFEVLIFGVFGWLGFAFLLFSALRNARLQAMADAQRQLEATERLKMATEDQTRKILGLMAIMSGQMDKVQDRSEAWSARADELLQAIEKNSRKA
jgi:hypothetical protein